MGEFPEDLKPERLARQPFDLVETKIVQPVLGFGRRQPFEPAVKATQVVFDGYVMNSGRGSLSGLPSRIPVSIADLTPDREGLRKRLTKASPRNS